MGDLLLPGSCPPNMPGPGHARTEHIISWNQAAGRSSPSCSQVFLSPHPCSSAPGGLDQLLGFSQLVKWTHQGEVHLLPMKGTQIQRPSSQLTRALDSWSIKQSSAAPPSQQEAPAPPGALLDITSFGKFCDWSIFQKLEPNRWLFLVTTYSCINTKWIICFYQCQYWVIQLANPVPSNCKK